MCFSRSVDSVKLTSGATKRSAASITAFGALSLSLTACGSGDEADAVASSTATVTSTQAAQSSGEDPVSPSASASGDSAKPGAPAAPGQDAQGGDGQAAAGAPLQNPFEDPNFTPPTQEPLQGGGAGTADDKKQMEETMHLALNPPSAEKWTRVLMENSCRKVTQPVQEEMNRNGYTLEQIEQAAHLQAEAGQGMALPKSTVSLSDVRVDGNRASATASVSNENGTQEQTQIFEREDGRWKLCN